MESKKETGKGKREGKKSRGISSGIVILFCLVCAFLLYSFWLGDVNNFMGAEEYKAKVTEIKGSGADDTTIKAQLKELKDNSYPPTKGHPANMKGTVYKGGFTVALVITLLLTVVCLSIERFIALTVAKGNGNLINFVYDVKKQLAAGKLKEAEALCAKQKGSVAAIVDAGLKKYQELDTPSHAHLSVEERVTVLKEELEEATSLELPSWQQNLPVIATISTLGTLFGLFGTVLGMIRAFGALANEGSPDSVALSAGISEALVNTALGILTGALAIIMYGFFTGKIDNMTYAIDEMGFALTQTYTETHTNK